MSGNELNNQNNFIKYVEQLVESKINKMRPKEWRIGTIKGVFNKYLALVLIQGSLEPITIPTNPEIRFFPGDQVLVLYINGESKNKYVMSKCAINK